MVLCVFAVRCGQTSGRRHQTSSFCRCGWPCPSFVQHFHSLAHDETIVSSAIALTLFCGCFYDLWHMADVDVLFNIVAMNFLSCARLLALIYMCICMFVFCLGWIMWSCMLHCSRTFTLLGYSLLCFEHWVDIWQCVRSNHLYILLVHGTAAGGWRLCCLHCMFSHGVNLWITCGWWLHVHKIRRILPVVVVSFTVWKHSGSLHKGQWTRDCSDINALHCLGSSPRSFLSSGTCGSFLWAHCRLCRLRRTCQGTERKYNLKITPAENKQRIIYWKKSLKDGHFGL